MQRFQLLVTVNHASSLTKKRIFSGGTECWRKLVKLCPVLGLPCVHGHLPPCSDARAVHAKSLAWESLSQFYLEVVLKGAASTAALQIVRI